MPIIPIVKTSLFCATILGKSLWYIAIVCKQTNSLNVILVANSKNERGPCRGKQKEAYLSCYEHIRDSPIEPNTQAKVDNESAAHKNFMRKKAVVT